MDLDLIYKYGTNQNLSGIDSHYTNLCTKPESGFKFLISGTYYKLPSLGKAADYFIYKHGIVIMMPSFYRGKITALVLRAIKTKDLMYIKSDKHILFGIDSILNDYKRQDPIIIVEGALDRQAILPFHKKTVSLLSCRLSCIQMTYVSSLFDNVYLMYDNDKAGKEGAYNDYKSLAKEGVKVKILTPAGKDPGEFIEVCYTDKKEAQKYMYYYKKLKEGIV